MRSGANSLIPREKDLDRTRGDQEESGRSEKHQGVANKKEGWSENGEVGSKKGARPRLVVRKPLRGYGGKS